MKGSLWPLPDEEADCKDVEEDAKAAHRHHHHPLNQVGEPLDICINLPTYTSGGIHHCTQGNPGLLWVIFHVESTIDYFVCFSLIIWEFKT